VILSLAYCYHARLPREERKTLVTRVVDTLRAIQEPRNRGYQYDYGAPYGGYGEGLTLIRRSTAQKTKVITLSPSSPYRRSPLMMHTR
jgi:hypothetical protein